jgi:hypothetical protein
MHQVEIERAYRIVGALEKTARDIEERAVPFLEKALDQWRRRVIVGDVVVLGLLLALLAGLTVQLGWWQGLSFRPPWDASGAGVATTYWGAVALFLAAAAVHFGVRRLAARSLLGWLREQAAGRGFRGDLIAAFAKSTRPWRSIFCRSPAGWGRRSQRHLARVLEETDNYVQTLNDRFTNPSGDEPMTVLEAPSPLDPEKGATST